MLWRQCLTFQVSAVPPTGPVATSGNGNTVVNLWGESGCVAFALCPWLESRAEQRLRASCGEHHVAEDIAEARFVPAQRSSGVFLDHLDRAVEHGARMQFEQRDQVDVVAADFLGDEQSVGG
ncbi:hypothetical protein H7J73_20110 [Mycolicibacterium komossense]|uniref:Uncharacterized protein n=1 Tax=Mycolicibacterium komossense TaxID=1779 RepID=A0ABT3CFQ8_9MYCO|nr:hypothetical protein [Mycolicibacterium komossense]